MAVLALSVLEKALDFLDTAIRVRWGSVWTASRAAAPESEGLRFRATAATLIPIPATAFSQMHRAVWLSSAVLTGSLRHPRGPHRTTGARADQRLPAGVD